MALQKAELMAKDGVGEYPGPRHFHDGGGVTDECYVGVSIGGVVLRLQFSLLLV
jgi:hypothetical protein